MMVRLVLGVVVVANILVLVVCSAENTQTAATSESASATSTSSNASSSSSSEAVTTSKPVKCRRTKKCPKNEEFSSCAQSLQRAQYCTEKAEPFSASDTTPDKSSCKEACVCKENYLRAANGTCIPAEQCPLICPANELLDNCPSDCDSDYCPTEEVSEAATCATPDVCPPPICKCTFNHRRASNGSCIPTRECPPFTCKTNEEFNACPPLCPTDDCSQASPSGQCPPQFGHIGIILPCNPKCRCIKDYWRLDGICVPYGQCPGVCPVHERYSACLQGECKALNCTQKDKSILCARIDPKYCKKGCVCEEGYLRNADGVCVLEDQCEPVQLSCTSANEEYVPCMQGVCRAKNCSQKGQDVPCPDVPTEQCDSGCICKENFLRAANGTCIPAEQCPLICADNELLDNCPSDCDSDYCPTEEVSEAATCATPDVCPPPICKCTFNHRRASNGSCIPTRECPPFACKTNEEFNACPPLCPTDDCSQASPSGQCPPQFGRIGIILPCNPKCRCIKDYWRLDGICVPYGQCPGVCPAHERYSGCLQGECKALSCTQKDQSIPCARIDPKYCEKGCVCEEGFLRNADGVCVLEDQCESGVCPAHERYSGCLQGECKALNCTQKDQSILCARIDPKYCKKGCVCEEGYLRNADGVCVLEDQCEPVQPTCTSANEEYVPCMQGVCRAKNCSQKGQEVPCPDVPTEQCDSGCMCKENFLRAVNGTCIPAEQCPLICADNELLDNCPSDCDSDYCPTEEVSEAATCATPDVCPPPICKCTFNHRRASNGSCIPTRECPPFACKTNEEFNACPPLCPTDDCSQASPSGQCPPQFGRIGIILPCNPKCRCIKDYWRLDGICVPYGQCPGVCPAHERYSGCLQGECKALNCTQKDQSIPCARIDPKYCEKGCVCEEGYLRNANGVCVLEDQCESGVCPAHERYSGCLQGECKALNCTQKDQSIPCARIDPKYCEKGCVCEEGYLRNADGVCVLEDQCEPLQPSCTSANEEYVACMQGVCRAKNCSQKGQEVPCPDVPTEQCDSGCICKENFLRAANGTCIPAEQCPLICADNELLDNCPSDCDSDYCPTEEVVEAATCATPDVCPPPICKCTFNHRRASNGSCIPTRECPPFACKTNEEFNACPPLCPTDDCSQASPSGQCPPQFGRIGIILPCNPKCRCIKDYWRLDGICVPYGQCPGVCPAHERYSGCLQGECKALNCTQKDQSIPCAQIDPKYCEKGCVCEEGYLRNADGVCVLEDQCESGVCPANERYSGCLQGECKALNCTQKDQSIPCARIDPKYCEKGCVCEEGYLRNADGVCVLEDQCEPVQPSCTSANEEYVPCMQGVCRAKNCSQKGQDVPCPDVPTEQCDSGCICKENFLRAANGTCIPAEQCPLICADNELLDNCPSDCDSDYCPTEEVSEAATCATPDVCPPPICKCTFNHRRASNGSCIPTRECPPFACKTNEEFNACPPLCPTDDCSQASPSGQCPPQFGRIGIILPCNPKCRCIKDYWRLDGICVPYGQCPGVCPAHERYSGCLQGECKALNCTQKDQSIPCARIDPKYCEKGCVCEEGYLRNADGVCVLEDKCEPLQPSCTSANEEYVPCMQGVCRAKNCSQKGQDAPCPDVPTEQCDSGCICKENFLRAENGTCVPEDNCEPTSCSINEELSNCTQAVCRAQECYDKYLSIPCPSVPEESCKIGCVCKWGYLRDLNNVCIPSDDCPTNPCEHNKRPTNCTQAKCVQKCFEESMPQGCPLVAEGDCKEGCVCQEGYLEAEDGYCVPEDQCESTKCPPFEQWSFCSNAVCSPQHCYQKGWPLPCPSVSQCDPGCLCQGNYLRNESGVCVPEEKCDTLNCSANEEWSACAQATCRAQNCTEKGKPVVCPFIADGFCEEACVCKENYLRDENGDCVPENKCEPQLTCSENEILDDCPPTCNTDNCPQSADDEEKWCVQADPCVPACKCRFNYKRTANGTCIPTTDCPAFDCSAKPNEEYVSCPPFCPSDECGKPRLEGRCPFKIGVVLQCKPKCQCKDGYGRVNDTCVPFAECPDLCPANEVYSSCMQRTCRPQNCSNRDVAMETCPTIDEASCQRGCVCQENFYRNDEGVCVPLKCEARNCSANEEWSTCAQATCRAQNCTEKGKPVVCPIITDGSCEEACVCKENYLRDENGDCVPEDQCEPQLSCGKNEVLDDCPPTCNTDNCPRSANDEDVWCAQADPCVPACKCRFNYKRAANGTCIPTTDCPAFDCSAKPNEEYVSCPPFCPSDECGKPRLEGRCPFKIGVVLQCKPKCQCKDGYGRVNETCVPFAECPDLCPTNEVYSPCMQQTCRPQNCSNRDVAMETCPTIDEASCQRGCVCQENFYRNSGGICVSYEECGGPMCPNAHEVYTPNFMKCPPNICNSLVARYKCYGNQKEEPACACKPGYLRLNETSACIPICECPEMKSSSDCK